MRISSEYRTDNATSEKETVFGKIPQITLVFSIAVTFILIGLGGVFDPVTASETKDTITAEARIEIDHLLHYIENSSCLFRRNGDWYGAREAANHIRSKYRYLVDRGKIESTEDFIDKSASRSSISGRLYLVRCATRQIASSQWLEEELDRFRTAMDTSEQSK